MARPLHIFFRSMALLLLLNAAVKPAWILLIDREVQLQAGAGIYGRYFALLNFSMLFTIVADAGLSVYVNRQGAAAGLNTARFRLFLRMKLLLLCAYAFVVLLAAFACGVPVNGLLLLLIALQAATSLLVFLRNALTALQLYRADAWISVLDKLLVIAFMSWVLFLARPSWHGINWFAAIQLVTVCATIVVTGIVLNRHLLHTAAAVHEPFSIRSQISNALPYFAVVLFMTLTCRAQGVLVQRLHENGDAEAGLYANGFRLLDALNMGGYLVASFLLPFISKHAANRPLMVTAVRQSRNFLWLMAATAAGFCLFNYQWLHQWLYHDTGEQHALISVVTVAGIIGCSLVHVYSTALTGLGYIKLLARISLAAALLTLAAGFVWIPGHGALAAACITAFGQLAYGLALMAACSATQLLPADSWGWIKLLVVTGIIILLLFAVQQLPPLIQLAVLCLAVPAAAIILKLVPVSFFKSRQHSEPAH